MARPRHPNQYLERCITEAERLGWRVVIGNGHAWGRLFCPLADRSDCIISVWSTPKNPENHARQILSRVSCCPHFERPVAKKGG